MKITTLLSQKSDNVGIISSVLCLIHCLLLPVAISAMSVANHVHDHLGHDHHHDHVHGSLEFMDYIFWVFSLIAVYYSARQTTHNRVRLAFAFAGLLFTAGILFKEVLPFGHAWSYAGSFCLILTHYYNMRYCKHCSVAHKH